MATITRSTLLIALILCILTAGNSGAEEFKREDHPPHSTVVVPLSGGVDSLSSHLPSNLVPAAEDAIDLYNRNRILITHFAAYCPDSLGTLFNFIQFKSFTAKFFDDSFGEMGADLIRKDLDLYDYAFDISKDSAELFSHKKFQAMWRHYEKIAQRLVNDFNLLMESRSNFVGAFISDIYVLLSVSSPREKEKFPQFANAMTDVFIKRKPIIIATPYATTEAISQPVVQFQYLENKIQMCLPEVHENGSLKWELVFYMMYNSDPQPFSTYGE